MRVNQLEVKPYSCNMILAFDILVAYWTTRLKQEVDVTATLRGIRILVYCSPQPYRFNIGSGESNELMICGRQLCS